MSAETALLAALAARLAEPGLLLPAPVQIGVLEPAAQADLPAVVLSLPEVRRLGAGLGERSALITQGALPVQARIDLANPVLAEEPSLRLLSADRLTLVLPHGGWVKADGSSGPLAAADLQVSIGAQVFTVVNAAPAAGQVQPDATIGSLRFGAPLPATGIIQARYVLGQWERRTTPIAGVLQMAVQAGNAADTRTLSDALIDALDDAGRWPSGLRKLALAKVGSVALPSSGGIANSRSRVLAYAFEHDHHIDRAESSGGVIHRIPITTRLAAVTIDMASGAETISIHTEVSA